MAVNLSPVGGVAAQFFTNTGAVLTGGKLFTYLAGTTTPATAYTSSNGSTAWTNPIVLDAAGRVPSGGEIWITDGISYKFVLKDSTDVLIATYDNITGINSNSVSFTNQQQIITATANQTVFNLSISYQPGTNSLSVFVDGVNQYGPGAQYAYTETDSDTVTFTSGLHVGAEVKFTTTQQQGAGAVDSSQVTYDPPFTGSVATNVEAKLAQSINVKDFGATGNGTTDDTAAIQTALTYCVNNELTLYIPSGIYLVTSTIITGNAAGQQDNPVVIIGDGKTSVIKVTSTLANGAIRIRGLNGEVDVDRHFGRVQIENLLFNGPGRYSMSPAGLGLSFYGVQGITLKNVYALGWSEAIKFHNCDLVTMYACQAQANTTGIATENSGYALGGQLNSFTVVGSWFNNNTQFGIDYHGGLKPTFIGNNFSANGTSLNISNTAETSATTQSPTIEGNYFESDTASMIIIGGLAGIVTAGSVSNNTMLPTGGTTAITVGNMQTSSTGSPCRIYDNVMGGGAVFTPISQATSVQKADYKDAFMQVIPAFLGVYVSNAANQTGDGTVVTLVPDTQRFDTLNNYDVSNGKFTAPFAGYYEFSWSLRLFNVTAATSSVLTLAVSGGTSYDMVQSVNPQGLISGAAATFTMSGSSPVYMAANQTAELSLQISGEASAIVGIAGGQASWFAGKMISS
jgi:hypothetical protein